MDLFPEEAAAAEEKKKTDILSRLKARHKSTALVRFMRHKRAALQSEINEEKQARLKKLKSEMLKKAEGEKEESGG